MAHGDVTITTQITGTTTSGRILGSFTNTKVFTGIANEIEREVTVPTASAITLISIGTPVAGSQLAVLNHFEIKNQDSTNFVKIGLIVSGSKATYHNLKPGQTFSTADKIDANASGGAFSAFSDITSITAQADTGACVCTYKAF